MLTLVQFLACDEAIPGAGRPVKADALIEFRVKNVQQEPLTAVLEFKTRLTPLILEGTIHQVLGISNSLRAAARRASSIVSGAIDITNQFPRPRGRGPCFWSCCGSCATCRFVIGPTDDASCKFRKITVVPRSGERAEAFSRPSTE